MQAVTEYRWDQRLDQAQIHLRMRRIAHFSVGSNVFRLFLRKGIKNEGICQRVWKVCSEENDAGAVIDGYENAWYNNRKLV